MCHAHLPAPIRALPISMIFPPLLARLMPGVSFQSLQSTARAAALLTAHHLAAITPSADRHDSPATWPRTRKEPLAFRSGAKLGQQKLGQSSASVRLISHGVSPVAAGTATLTS